MMDWDRQVDEVYDGMTTKELTKELKETRYQISRDFAAADIFKASGQENLANPRRAQALAFTKRAKRMSTILDKRGSE